MRPAFLLLALSVSVAGAACKHVPLAGECAESVNLTCLTAKVCAMDSARGCMRCECGPGSYVPANQPPPPGSPPLQR